LKSGEIDIKKQKFWGKKDLKSTT